MLARARGDRHMDVLTPSAIDPITVITAADVDGWSNDFRGAADARIPGILAAAVGHAEAMLNRAVFEQTRRTVTRCYPISSLHVEPFASVSVTRVATDGTEEDIDNDKFVIDTGSGTIDPRNDALFYRDSRAGYGRPYFPWEDATWWSTQSRYRFDYICGWTAATLPAVIRTMILGLCVYVARFRESANTNGVNLKMIRRSVNPYVIPPVTTPAWVLA